MTDLEVKPCPKCGLPVDPVANDSARHAAHCIGETPYVLHNRKAGMVVYLSEDEWTAMQNANQGGLGIDSEMATAITQRAVHGITEP